MVRNCLSYTLQRVHESGGSIVLCTSRYSTLAPHVRHMDADQQITHYAPFGRLRHPTLALVGFHGHVASAKAYPTPPMPLHTMVIGAWIGAIGVTCWAVATAVRKTIRRH